MSFKILFGGDFVYSNDIEEKNFEISKEYKEIIGNHNIFCCNLEGPIISEKANKIKKIGPNINNDAKAVKKLTDLGCNLFCLANNHIFDYNKDGIAGTLEFLDKERIVHIGAGLTKEQIYSPYNIEINGINICIINIAENGFGAAIGLEHGYAYAFDPKIKELIKKNREDSDFLIIVSHMGAEHWEIPLPEVREYYKELVDCGVDAVIAHHPHIPQGWEEYKGKPIFYSLGNFIFDKGKGIQNPKSYSVSITLEKKDIIKYEIIPTIFDNYELKLDSEDYNSLANILKNDLKYESILKGKIKQAYEKYKNSYYKVVSYDRGNTKEKLKGFIKRTIFRMKFQDIWLYHNINIETHFWICKRATRIIMEEKYGGKN